MHRDLKSPNLLVDKDLTIKVYMRSVMRWVVFDNAGQGCSLRSTLLQLMLQPDVGSCKE